MKLKRTSIRTRAMNTNQTDPIIEKVRNLEMKIQFPEKSKQKLKLSFERNKEREKGKEE